jgi:hypothetical protein
MATVVPRSAGTLDGAALRRRLAALRRRLRLVTTARGGSWLLALVLACVTAACVLDWKWPLPAVVRAFLLAGTLVGAGVVAFRQLVRPLAARADDLTLALKVEEHYPTLNDCLASTVQFLDQQTPAPAGESAGMRREAVRRALGRAEGLDFRRVVSARGLPTAAAAAAVALAGAVTLLILFPAQAATALARLASPFGGREWPTKTRIALEEPPSRIGRGSPFHIRARISGVVPEKAVVSLQPRGGNLVTEQHRIEVDDDGDAWLNVELPAGRVEKTFKFRVEANDAKTRWHEVEVLPPPMLVYLNGQPSPQVRLDYPSYTGLPSPSRLPAGSGNVDAVIGTTVTVRAATDRPLARAWVELRPEPVERAQVSWPLAAALFAEELAVSASRRGNLIPATLDEDRRELTVRFTPRAAGFYALHFVDDLGLANYRLFELRLKADPPPDVKMLRPPASSEALPMLATTDVPVHVLAEDTVYALRSAWLSVRHKNDPTARELRLPLYDHQAARRERLAPALGAVAVAMNEPRPQRLDARRALRLSALRYPDGTAFPVKNGDRLIVQAFADDFDDVLPLKGPGYSHEVEIYIVDRSGLEAALNTQQTDLEKKLQALKADQQAARRKVQEVENKLRNGEKLTEDDLARLLQAEQDQRDIKDSVTREKDGLRADVNKARDALRRNGLQNSSDMDRLNRLAKELDRLAENELEQAPARIAEARQEASLDEQARADRKAQREEKAKLLEQAAAKAEQEARDRDAAAEKADRQAADEAGDKRDKLKADAARQRQQAARLREEAARLKDDAEAERDTRDLDPREGLADARKQQEEVEKTLNDLLAQMERDAREIKRDANRLLQEERALQEQTQRLAQEQDRNRRAGKTFDELTPREQDDLKALAEQQQRLEERTQQLLERMRKLEQEQKNKDQETLKELQEARERAEKGNQEELNRLAREQEAARKKLQELEDKERALQDRLKDADRIDDPKRREEAQRRLAEEQKRLQEEEQRTRQQMARLKADLDEQPPGNATSLLREAREQIGQNKLSDAAKSQKGATRELKKLVDALDKGREDELDRLARKQKEAEKRLQELMDREEALQKKIKDTDKIEDRDKREQALKNLADEQRALRDEAKKIQDELARLRVNRAGEPLKEAIDQMDEAVKRLERGQKPDPARQEEVLDREAEAQEEVQKARKKNEDELTREQLARVADVLRRFKERQESFVAEAKRVQTDVQQARAWPRPQRLTLRRQADAQHGLSVEAGDVAAKDLTSTPVFARMLRWTAESMEAASKRLQEITDEKAPAAPDTLPDAELTRHQAEALRRLERLLEAVQEQADQLARAADGGGGGDGGDGGGNGGGGDGGLPPPAQLKLLYQLQLEVKQKTEEFRKKHPDPEKLTDKEKAERQALRKMQQDVLELFEELRRPAGEQPNEREGDKK